MEVSKRTANAVFVVLLLAVALLIGLVFYNYSQSGQLSYSSLIIALIVLIVSFSSKAFFKK